MTSFANDGSYSSPNGVVDHGFKNRAQSESPMNTYKHDPFSSADNQIISSAEIFSYKMKKEYDDSIYAAYCIHVSLQSGLKWVVERRYTQFRELRKEIMKLKPELEKAPFPGKVWLFNFSKGALKSRQKLLNKFLKEVVNLSPQLMEMAIFLEVEIHLSRERLRHSYGSGSMKRSLSFGQLNAPQSSHGRHNKAVTIHDFHIIKVLGKGSFGKVFLVRSHHRLNSSTNPTNPLAPAPQPHPSNNIYAMKVLLKSEVLRRQQVEHTLTERYILSHVHHPFLLSLHCAFQTKGRLYMVVDYCPGGELFFHLKRLRRFTEGMMRFYCAEISVALCHLHSHRIIYRDLKPENILLDSRGHIKLTDFGLSKLIGGGRDSHGGPGSGTGAATRPHSKKSTELTFCGTPEYLSPEMILHRKSGAGYDQRVDWWSLGIVCYELLIGRPPFFDRDFLRMCDKILYRQLNFPAQRQVISLEAQSLVRALLCREVDKRMLLPSDYMLPPAAANPTSPPSPSPSTNPPYLHAHPFFSDMDFTSLFHTAAPGSASASGMVVSPHVLPPYVPPKPKDIYDTINFDTDFTRLSAHLSIESEDGEGGGASSSGKTRDERAKSRDARMREAFLGFSFSTQAQAHDGSA